MELNETLNSNSLNFNASDSEENCTNSGVPVSDFLHQFQLYYFPTLCILGIIGNSLSVVVFYKTKLRKVSSSYYLASLAISDNVFLVCLFIPWLTPYLEFDIFNLPIICETSTYITSLTSFLSVWLVLAFTVERFLAVVYPLHRQTVCSISHTKRAKYIVIVLLLFGMLINFPVLLFVGISRINCEDRCCLQPEWDNEAYIYNIVDSLVTYVLPVTGIAILNGFISRHMWSMAQVRRRLTNQNSAAKEEDTMTSKYKKKSSTSLAQYKFTKMLLVVSTTCLCLNLPSYVMRIMALIPVVKDEISQTETVLGTFLHLQQYAQQMFYANFGINFILYCISGQNFRKAVKSLLFPRKFRRRNTSALDSRTQSTSTSMIISKKKRHNINMENTESNSNTQIIGLKGIDRALYA
ncbi:thyrotropin-releasing hormone receptor [Onthophagus taurus]|uniref:thyrotropin-releasing hormone receptor n=1 Tax=Onthophagus taurus TaxID=166361 RepID=UPI000C2060F2|nr:thyrotropin-releasing hormone receptor-like [Onthophagus taurus]